MVTDLQRAVLRPLSQQPHQMTNTPSASRGQNRWNNGPTPTPKTSWQRVPYRRNNRQNGVGRSTLRCNVCNKLGHLANSCWYNRSNIRRIYEDEKEFSNEGENKSMISEREEECEGNCAVIFKEKEKENVKLYSEAVKLGIGKEKREREKKERKFPKDIVLLERYINGDIIKRKEKKELNRALAMTVITTKNEEKARNKPIIFGSVHGKRSKIFLDSGADLNLSLIHI